MSDSGGERCSILACRYCGAEIGPRSNTIKNALKRIGMYPKERNGKNSKIK